MTTALRQRRWFSRIRFLATSIALALQILLVATLVITPSAQAQTFTVLYSFTGGADGGYPWAPLIRDSAGNLYGTANLGGDLTCNNFYGCGTVFKLDTTGTETVLYSFTDNPDGAYPVAGLIRDAAGNLYGTTEGGGAVGIGAVFKLDANGNETVLHSFTAGVDGANPLARLIRGAAGNLYGTTIGGGVADRGIVFKLDATGKEAVLHSFAGADGTLPYAGLIRDTAGNLYGTTNQGGAFNLGTVFKLALNTTGKYKVLYSFTGGADGKYPFAALVRDATGNLYGTTYYGGSDVSCNFYGCGTVFKLDRTGKETVLYRFTGGADGSNPGAGLVRDAAGNLYGTTRGGGSGYGTVFKLDTTGNETVLHSFTGADGVDPYAGLIRDAAGNLYGTTVGGGVFDAGTVFKLTP